MSHIVNNYVPDKQLLSDINTDMVL